jgi:hypothetical protein
MTTAAAWADPGALTVTGGPTGPLRLSIDEIRQLPPARIMAETEHGGSTEYDCVTIAAFLSKADFPMGESIRGKKLADYLIAEAHDGYRAVFSLPEIDPQFTDRTVYLCHTRSGRPLPADEGPFRLIIPKEQRHARWMRQVELLSVRTAP